MRLNLNVKELKVLEDFYGGLQNIFYSVKFRNSSDSNYLSKSAEDITGYSIQELKALPETYHSLILNEDLESFKKQLTALEIDSSKNSCDFIYRITKKNGEIIWLQESLKVERNNNNSNVTAEKSIVVNIDDIKKAEFELSKSNNALKELNTAKDKFINIISHDIRAPFTTLLGFSEILLNETDLTEDEKNEYLKYIYEASKSQLEMINCLLDWSRLQTGRIKVEPVRLNVKSVVSTAITPLTGDAVRKNIDVRIDIPADLHINADERLISQVIVNLTSNALKYTPEGKEIHITSNRFKEGMIEIIVRDEGLGIAEEYHTKLFRIDEKFSLVGTSGEKGSGLGLTLVKEIMDKHNGQIWFYSQIGEGSEFHITVPEAKNVILFIESDLNIREIFKKNIEDVLKNFEVKFSDNGYQAISKYRELIPTIIIANHDMPLMNGIQLVEALQKKESNRTIPVIIISDLLSEDALKKYKRLGVENIIYKPVNNDQLIQIIRDCLY